MLQPEWFYLSQDAVGGRVGSDSKTHRRGKVSHPHFRGLSEIVLERNHFVLSTQFENYYHKFQQEPPIRGQIDMCMNGGCPRRQ